MAGRNTSIERLRRRLREGFPGSASPGRWRWWRLAGGPNIYNSGWQGLASYSSSFRQSGFYGDAGVWTLGARQQWVDNSRPLSQRSPSLSCRTSHLRPSRPSREGFGAGASEKVRRGLILSCSLDKVQLSNLA